MILLDTHYLLWVMLEPKKLSIQARQMFENEDVPLFFSAASVAEIEIKKQLGKILIPDFFYEKLKEAGFLELPVRANHAAIISQLPNIHRDPFDRLLLAQVIYEEWELITSDEKLLAYQTHYPKISRR